MREPVVANPWRALSRFTPAHVGLGRAGVSLPTAAHLAFQLAHAMARDAVHDALDVARVRADVAGLGLPSVHLHSAAPDRAGYLQRPDLGRRLDDASLDTLALAQASAGSTSCDLAFVVVDGLSCRAAQRAPGFIGEVLERLRDTSGEDDARWRVGPVAVVEQGRVAIGDVIGDALGAAVVVVMIGERPGLSSPDSLGAYLTWAPRPGRTDAERNCLSNIRPAGLRDAEAATRLVGLLRAARRRGASGVGLKDEHDMLAGATGSPSFLIGD